MKLRFRGWEREVFPHEHNVLPVFRDKDWTYKVRHDGECLEWQDDKTAFGKVNGLGLNGSFLVEFEFEHAELECWLRQYVAREPEAAIRLLSSMQGEAVIALSRNSTKDLKMLQ